MLNGRESNVMTAIGNHHQRNSPVSLAGTLKEHRDLMADYHHQLQQLQQHQQIQLLQQQQKQQHEQQQRHLNALRNDSGAEGRRSPRSPGGSRSPPESPLQDADQHSDLDEFMDPDNEDAVVALDLVGCEAHAYHLPFSTVYVCARVSVFGYFCIELEIVFIHISLCCVCGCV